MAWFINYGHSWIVRDPPKGHAVDNARYDLPLEPFFLRNCGKSRVAHPEGRAPADYGRKGRIVIACEGKFNTKPPFGKESFLHSNVHREVY